MSIRMVPNLTINLRIIFLTKRLHNMNNMRTKYNKFIVLRLPTRHGLHMPLNILTISIKTYRHITIHATHLTNTTLANLRSSLNTTNLSLIMQTPMLPHNRFRHSINHLTVRLSQLLKRIRSNQNSSVTFVILSTSLSIKFLRLHHITILHQHTIKNRLRLHSRVNITIISKARLNVKHDNTKLIIFHNFTITKLNLTALLKYQLHLDQLNTKVARRRPPSTRSNSGHRSRCNSSSTSSRHNLLLTLTNKLSEP